MKSGFKDPIAHKEKPAYKPVDGKKSPWDFTAPEYDQRSSCFVNAGEHHGVGHRQPVGHSDGVKQRVSVLPFSDVKAMKIDEKG